MTWEWSHTQEAYEFAREMLGRMPKSELVVIAAEWTTNFDLKDWQELYDTELEHYSQFERGDLIQMIWQRASQQRLCENGGFEAWLCPYGCGPHLVPFGPPEENDNE